MSDSIENEKVALTPENGFNLVGKDPFASEGNQLYLVEHFELYQEALNAKKERKMPEEYLILYKGPGGEFLSR